MMNNQVPPGGELIFLFFGHHYLCTFVHKLCTKVHKMLVGNTYRCSEGQAVLANTNPPEPMETNGTHTGPREGEETPGREF